jgi:hypothetical protein
MGCVSRILSWISVVGLVFGLDFAFGQGFYGWLLLFALAWV